MNKFLGDGIFVFFGAPVFQADHAARAVAAALECQDEVAALNRELVGEFDPPVQIRMRIGLATGKVMVGDCGSSDKQDYTAIGPTVNLASRLEGANKFFKTRILTTRYTYDLVGVHASQWLVRPLGKIIVVGTSEPVEVWNPLCPRADAPNEMIAACERFTAGMTAFAAGDFATAAKAMGDVLAVWPDDGAAKVYLDLCRTYEKSRPEGWQVVRLTEK